MRVEIEGGSRCQSGISRQSRPDELIGHYRERKVEGARSERALVIALSIAIVAFLMIIARTPLQRLYTMVRLYRQELRAPLLVPVAGVRRSAPYDSWGLPRGGGRRHEGIDIFAPCGRPVLSATEGIILSVGENKLGGDAGIYRQGRAEDPYPYLVRK